MHLRNYAGRTPLFLAANAGLPDHVRLLRESGAHLHADEHGVAELHARRRPEVWALAGVDMEAVYRAMEMEGGASGAASGTASLVPSDSEEEKKKKKKNENGDRNGNGNGNGKVSGETG